MRYPREIFSINETITRNNMREYDRMLDKMHTAQKQEEKRLGRRMTFKERIDFCNNFEKNYYLNKEN